MVPVVAGEVCAGHDRHVPRPSASFDRSPLRAVSTVFNFSCAPPLGFCHRRTGPLGPPYPTEVLQFIRSYSPAVWAILLHCYTCYWGCWAAWAHCPHIDAVKFRRAHDFTTDFPHSFVLAGPLADASCCASALPSAPHLRACWALLLLLLLL
jgi:hypothetical protein